MNRRRIQSKVAVELETVSLRLPIQLVRAVEQHAKYLGGSTDRTYVITRAIVDRPSAGRRVPEDPQRQAGCTPGPPRPHDRVAAVPTHLQNTDLPGGAQPARPASSRNTAVLTPTLSADLAGPSPFTLR